MIDQIQWSIIINGRSNLIIIRFNDRCIWSTVVSDLMVDDIWLQLIFNDR